MLGTVHEAKLGYLVIVIMADSDLKSVQNKILRSANKLSCINRGLT
jgi:hypothetical protein